MPICFSSVQNTLWGAIKIILIKIYSNSNYMLYIFLFSPAYTFVFVMKKNYKIYILCQLENPVFIHLGGYFTTGSRPVLRHEQDF